MPVYRRVGAGSRIALCAVAVSLAACEVNLNTEGVVSRETKSFKVAGIPDVQLDTFEGAIEELPLVHQPRVTRVRQRHRERGQPGRPESRVHALQLCKAPQQESGAHEQHDGYRQLRHHQYSTQPGSAESARCSPTFRL